MNALLKPAPHAVTMTSIELVEFINSQRQPGDPELLHKNFLAKVPDVLGERSAEFLADLPDSYGRPRKGYRFQKREACLMAMSYSYDLQAKVFDRMTALESGAAPALNMRDPRQLAAAALQLIEVNQELQQTIEAQQQKIDQAAPMVQGFERIARSDGSMCITDAAKTLQVPPRTLTKFLLENGWVYRRPMGSGYLAYQPRIHSGHLEHKVTTGERSDGTEWSSTQVRVTAKGLARLATVVGQDATENIAVSA